VYDSTARLALSVSVDPQSPPNPRGSTETTGLLVLNRLRTAPIRARSRADHRYCPPPSPLVALRPHPARGTHLFDLRADLEQSVAASTTDREHRSDVIPPDTAKVAENHYAGPYE
jgi:hypothetical protein